MKNLFYLIICMCITSQAQNKFLTKTGMVTFEASVPAFEEVVAKNNAVTAILNIENHEFAALVLIKGFRFKNALMEEHFNENYAESDTYSKATFKGVIKDFSNAILQSEKDIMLNGELFFHGKTKKIENIRTTLIKDHDIVKMSGSFNVKSSDFDIVIPKIVRNKDSEVVKITFNFELKLQ